MKKFFVLMIVGLFCFFMASNAMAVAVYTPSLSDVDTFFQVSSGSLTGPDVSLITGGGEVGSDGTFDVTIIDEDPDEALDKTWGDVQIGRDATTEGNSVAYYGGSWADLTGYTHYELSIKNISETNDWFSANIYINTGLTDPPLNQPNYYYENGWTWVAPGQTVLLSLDLTTAVSLLGSNGGVAGHTIVSSELAYISSLGFNIGTNYGDGDYFGDDLAGKVVPIPGAVWLFGSGLIGLVGIRRKLRS